MENEKILNPLIDAPIGCYTASSEGLVLTVNHVMARMLGFQYPEELIQKHYDVEIFDSPEERNRLLNVLKVNGKAAGYECRWLRKGGNCFWVSVHGRMLHEADGNPTYQIFANNITRYKRIEKDLSQYQEKYNLLFAHSPLGLLHSNEKGEIIACNEDFVRIIGSSREAIIGLNILSLPDKTLVREVKKALNGETGYYEDLYTSITAGKSTPVRVHFLPVSGMNDHGHACIGIVEDISERKAVENEKKSLEVRLNQLQKMESIGRLTSGVAHDFNNMLSIINGYAEMIIEGLSTDDPLHPKIRSILDAGKRSELLARQLLSFARKQTLHPTSMNLNERIQGLIKILQRLIGDNIKLSWKPGNGLWNIRIDESQIDQIMVNLVVNSSDAGSNNIIVKTENAIVEGEEWHGSFVLLSVSDDGCGMDKTVRENLFKPFFTTKEEDSGTGLGLSTIYNIIKQNKGLIDVSTEVENGTTFRMFLPRFHNLKLKDDKEIDEAEERVITANFATG